MEMALLSNVAERTCGAVYLAVVALPRIDDSAHMWQTINIYALCVPVESLWLHLHSSPTFLCYAHI